MFASVIAHHSPLISDYGTPPSPPAAPPAPPTPPNPPQAEPIAFSVVTRASLFGIVGSATGTITLATVTCADASMTVAVSDAVPGLTFSYAANVLTVAGTPTGPTMIYRVVVSYVSSDGESTIRGTSEHEITIVDASEVLTIGDMAGASGRVGIPLSTTLASPTTNYAVDVTAHAGALVPGVAATMVWTRGASSGSGVVTLAGTPTVAGTYSLTVNYRNGAVELGTSTHAVLIAAAYETPASAPAPSPAPSPPAPSAPPAPTPAPAPGTGPDASLSGVRVLMRFDAATGIAYDHRGNTLTNSGATSTTGAVDEGASLNGALTFISGTVATLDGIAAGVSVECMADISATAWAALVAPGADMRFCPVASYTATDGVLIWALGFRSEAYYVGGIEVAHFVYPHFWTDIDNAFANSVEFGGGSAQLRVRPAKFMHLAGCLKRFSATVWERVSWLDGVSGAFNLKGLVYEPAVRATGTLRIGGTCPAFRSYDNLNPLVTIIPFTGVIDELRIKTPGQYVGNISGGLPPTAITPANRVIPWPNY